MTKNFDPRIPILIIILAAMSLMSSSHAYASETRTATYKDYTYCSGKSSVRCTSSSYTTKTLSTTSCSSCGTVHQTSKYNVCNSCNANLRSYIVHSPCSCGNYTGSSTTTSSTGSHGYISQSPCSHGYSSSHQVAGSGGYYYNTEYGYTGQSSTFTVYNITTDYGNITEKPTVGYKATGATATDYFLAGKTITMTLKNTTGMELTVDYNSTKEIVAIGETYTRTFTINCRSIYL